MSERAFVSHGYSLIGAAGYIAPRHLEAMASLGVDLYSALDPSDSVGILDRYFPNCRFFTRSEDFWADLREARLRQLVECVSVVSPNYLHQEHCARALDLGCHVVCEKPLALSSDGALELMQRAQLAQRHVFPILQLRLHPAVQELQRKLQCPRRSSVRHQVQLEYVTGRGPWYRQSWKGDAVRSGGVLSNIAVHFLDVLLWLFGPLQSAELLAATDQSARGHLELERASVGFFVSTDLVDVPEVERQRGKRTHRTLHVDGHPVDLSDGFEGLHTEAYQCVQQGTAPTIEDALPSLYLVDELKRGRKYVVA